VPLLKTVWALGATHSIGKYFIWISSCIGMNTVGDFVLRGCRLKVLVFAETGPPLSQNGDVLNADALVAQNGGLSASEFRRRKKLEARLARQALLSAELALLSDGKS
jgi:hypothetical protein